LAGGGIFARLCAQGSAARRGADIWGVKEGQALKIIVPVSGCAAILTALISVAGTAFADDNFPLAGNYTQNVACKGDGTDAAVTKVKITPQEIVSNVGVCTILDTKQNGGSMLLHVECKFPAGPLMGDITFTPRPDNTVEFVDRDMTYKAILHRCPN
jgi:hypothetical protein